MATDSTMSIPVRTQNPGDASVKIVDSTTPSQGLLVLPNGSINVNIISGSAGGTSPGDSGLVYSYIIAGQTVFIPATMQMLVTEELVVDGELLVDGALFVQA